MEVNIVKYVSFGLVQLVSKDLSLLFYNQNEIVLEYNTKYNLR